MAIATVQGTVSRIFHEGKGAEVVETFTARGEQISKKWAVWFDEPHGLFEGQEVEVSGRHGDKIDEWEDKQTGEKRHAVKRSLNAARLSGVEKTAPEPEPWPEPAPANGWAVSGDDSTPF